MLGLGWFEAAPLLAGSCYVSGCGARMAGGLSRAARPLVLGRQAGQEEEEDDKAWLHGGWGS